MNPPEPNMTALLTLPFGAAFTCVSGEQWTKLRYKKDDPVYGVVCERADGFVDIFVSTIIVKID